MVQFKKSDEFIEGGFARNNGAGNRIYEILVFDNRLNALIKDYYSMYTHREYHDKLDKLLKEGTFIIKKYGETNKGDFKYSTKSKPLILNSLNFSWYEPVIYVGKKGGI
jgi:hypothetical protein